MALFYRIRFIQGSLPALIPGEIPGDTLQRENKQFIKMFIKL